MAVEEEEAEPVKLIAADDEIEGDRELTEDFVFVRLGAAVPLKPSDSAFDLQTPPSQPLAVSQRHRLLFLSHSDGFYVAKTGDVVDLAKEIKEKGKGPSVEGVSVVDVRIGRVSILALSGDEMALAAAVGGEIFYYSVYSLLEKVREPSFSCSLMDSGTVKDFKWQKNMRKSFLVLSSHGSLYNGSLKGQLKEFMNNVDAVDWSSDGDFVAVARHYTITILASNFKELLSFSLSFQLWRPLCSSEYTIKVDSVKWVRDDSIIVGCFQVNEDGNEEGYHLQIITCKEHKFSETSSKPFVYSFSDVFDGAWDILPSGCGPYFLVSLLDCWDVILASNQKAIDQHILLTNWSIEDKRKEVVLLDITNDKYRPNN